MKRALIIFLIIFIISCTKVNEQQEETKEIISAEKSGQQELIQEAIVKKNNDIKEEKPDIKISQPYSSDNSKEFKIEAFQFGYNPRVIEVNPGDKVRITAWSKDVPHGLAIPEFNINMKLQDSTSQTVEFIADKKGTFTFYCSIPCGKGHKNMEGILVVK